MAKKDFKLVVVKGIKGGVGNTTITANLAVSLTKIGYKVIAVDYCKNNDLRLHFGMGVDRDEGVHKSLIENTSWFDAAFEDKNTTTFFPFGNIPHTELSKLNSLDSNYLINMLEQINFESQQSIVLIDYPTYLSLTGSLSAIEYDLKINVGTCEVASYTKLSILRNTLSEKDVLILNRYNPERKIESDIRTLISSEFDQSKILGVIFEDEFVHQALAQNTSIVDLNEYYKSSKDFYHLAMRLSSILFSPNGI